MTAPATARTLRLRRGSQLRRGSPDPQARPLYRSGYALVLNTIGTTVIGLGYWAVAAHLYDRQVLGRSSALVSALILVSSVAQLNLNNTLPRFLPLAGRRSGRLIRYSYAANAATALILGATFALLFPHFNAHWHFLATVATLRPAFVIAAIVWGVFALEDTALTGLNRAVVVPFENTIYGILKLILLVALVGLLPETGVFYSWTLPLILIVPAINWLIFGRYLREPHYLSSVSTVRSRDVIRFASVDYFGALLGQIYSNVLPLLVLSILGAAANGTFYIAWTITFGLALVPQNFATSMLVEGTSSPDRLGELTRGILKRCALLILPAVLLLVVAAHPILTIYGAKYASHASGLLAMLAISVIPRSVLMVVFALDRLQGRVGRAALTNLALTVLVLGWSAMMIRNRGVDGVALAWGGGNLAIAILRLPTVISFARGSHDRDATMRAGEPVSRSSSTDPQSLIPRPSEVRRRQAHRRRQPGRHRADA